jgi:alpha-L-rhamnosidase
MNQSEHVNAARWLSIRPLTADEFGPLHGAHWIGPADHADAQTDKLFAVGRDFALPADTPVVQAALHYWVDGRIYHDPTFDAPAYASQQAKWASVKINGRSETSFGELVRLLELRAARTVPVGHLLRPGPNRLVMLSWMSLPAPAVIVALDAQFADGTRQRLVSDDTWHGQVLTISEAQAADWEAALAGAPRAADRCVFGAEPWSDQRARLNHPQPPVVLRRGFSLPARPIASAVIEATAIGVYDMELNGRRVGDTYLAPGWTDTRRTVHVQSYDVASLLQPGDNVWHATVAKGWIGSPMQGCASMREDEKSLWAALTVRYAGGETIRVVTEAAGWEGCTGPVRDSEIYNGESVDLTHEPRWRPAIALPERATRMVPEPCAQPRIVREFPPVAIQSRGPRTWIVDFGQSFSGVVRLSLHEPRGTEVVLRHAEALRKDGALVTVNLRAAACTDRVVCPGGPFTFQPRFTFRGFRYVEVAGLAAAPAAIRGIAISSVTRQTLELDFADAQLNRLVEAIRWTQLSNWFSVPTDCPQRSERLAWLGDNELFAPSGLLLYDGRDFQSKHVADIFDAAHENGSPPEFAPCGGGAGPRPTYAYADAAVSLPYAIWQIYGDLALARRHWPAMRKYLQSLDAAADADGLVVHGAYGDWLTTEPKTPHAILGPVFQALTFRQAAEMGEALGDSAAAELYRRRLGEVGNVWRRRHLRVDGTIESDTQTIYACAWQAGLIPDGMKPLVARALRAAFARHNDHLRTGICGTARVLEALLAAGLDDVAWRILSDDTFPSYGYFLKNGATTMPEWWDPWPDGNEITEYWASLNVDRAQGEFAGSLNHPVFGAVLEGMVRHVWGLRQASGSAGFREVVIAPRFTDRLAAARGAFHSVNGTYKLAWQRQADGVRFEIEIPEGCRGTLAPLRPGQSPVALASGRTEVMR